MLPRRLAFWTLATAGVAVGHILGYALAHPTAAGRAAALSTHGYLAPTASVLIPLGLVSALVWAVRTARHLGVGLSARRLATAQIGVFVIQEVVERVASGEPPTAVLAERGVWLGLVAQVVVAHLVVRGVSSVRRVVRAVGGAKPLVVAAPPRVRLLLPVEAPSPARRPVRLGSRAPPVVV